MDPDPARAYAEYFEAGGHVENLGDWVTDLLERVDHEEIMESFGDALGQLFVLEPFTRRLILGDSRRTLIDGAEADRRAKQQVAAVLAAAESDDNPDVLVELSGAVLNEGIESGQGVVRNSLTSMLSWYLTARNLGGLLVSEIQDPGRFDAILAEARRIAAETQLDE
jgi:hypothetical protein